MIPAHRTECRYRQGEERELLGCNPSAPTMNACLAVGMSRSRLCHMRHRCLGPGKQFAGPGSGGDQRGAYPLEVAEYIARYLSDCRPPNFSRLAG